VQSTGERITLLSPARRESSGKKKSLRRRARRPYRPALLEAFAAVDGPALGRFERDSGFLAALRTDRLGFHPLDAAAGIASLHAVAFACLAALGLVLESLIHKKHLLAGGENELRTAFSALQNLVMVFHTLLRDRLRRGQEAVELASAGRRNAAWNRDILFVGSHKVTEEETTARIA